MLRSNYSSCSASKQGNHIHTSQIIQFLARLGRGKTVALVTLVCATASLLLTGLLVTLLNSAGYGLDLAIALQIAVVVSGLVAAPTSWFLIDLLLGIYRIEEEMRELASHDSLTGLLSRHAFFKAAGNHFSLARREGKIFSMLIVDLDYFKAINDFYGHAAGDAVLKLFADVTNSVSRQSDIIGRIGGEEFAMLLPSTTTEEALEFSGRLHAAINKATLTHNQAIIQYTASIGLTSFTPDSKDSIDSLLAQADTALYQAKHLGRNQTAVYIDPATQSYASGA